MRRCGLAARWPFIPEARRVAVLGPADAQWLVVEDACRQGVDVTGFSHLLRLESGVDLYERR